MPGAAARPSSARSTMVEIIPQRLSRQVAQAVTSPNRPMIKVNMLINSGGPSSGGTAPVRKGMVSKILATLRAYPNNRCIIKCMNEQKSKRTRQRTANNKTTTEFRVSDELWAVLQPILPVHVNTHRFGGGRPRVPDRRCADGIFFVLRTGCQWKALDQTDLCAGSTAHDRYQEWVEAGVFLKLWQVGLEQFDELKGLDWEWLSLDGAMTKAPLGGEKNRA
jgi:transposase